MDILPYMEQLALWKTLNVIGSLPLDDTNPGSVNALGTIVPEYHCPSFSGDEFVDPGSETMAITNYKAMGASHAASLGVALGTAYSGNCPGPHPDGGCFPGSTHGINGFKTDGSSHTIIVVETLDQTAARWTVGLECVVAGIPNAYLTQSDGNVSYYAPAGYVANQHFEDSAVPGQTYLAGLDGYEDATGCGAGRGPGSDHSGVTNHVFADGSVHSLRNAIDVALYMFLITRKGGDPTPDWD